MSEQLEQVMQEDAAAMLPDAEGPAGNVGQVQCAVCDSPGWLMDADESGFRIVHPGRPFACRAPR